MGQLKVQCLPLDVYNRASILGLSQKSSWSFFFHMKLEMSQEPQRLSERDAKNNPASVDRDKGMGQFRHAQRCRQMRLKPLD